ncbi:MAG: hypothetical protein R3D71_07365 [Rickettsiales bacterium]
MRKLLVIVLVVFVVTAAAALGISWNNRATAVKKDFETALAKLNTDNSSFSYDSLDVSGFPLNMTVSIKNPHIKSNIGDILKNTNFDRALKVVIGGSVKNWNEEVNLDGVLRISTNIFSNKFTSSINGNWQQKSTIGDEIFNIVSTQSSPSQCSLEIKNENSIFDNMWDFRVIKFDNDFPQKIRSLKCQSGSFVSNNADTNEKISSMDNADFSVSYSPNNGSEGLGLYIKFNNIEFTKAYDKIYSVYMKNIAPNQPVVPMSLYGKQSGEIDVSISLNNLSDWKNIEKSPFNMPFNINVNKYNISNALYDTDGKFIVHSKPDGDNINFGVDVKSEATTNELFRTVLRMQLSETLNQMIDNKLLNKKDNVEQKLATLTEEQRAGLIHSLIPDFASHGKTEFVLKGNVAGTKNFGSVDGKLSSLEYSTERYGIKADGYVKKDEKSLLPEGELNLVCNKCPTMIDDMYDYYNRIRNAINLVDPEQLSAVPYISPSTVQAVKNFLANLQADPANKTDLSFNIQSSGTVNGKNVGQIMGLFNQTVLPTLQQAPAR